MGNDLSSIISETNLFQDVELATAIGELKQNPAQLQQFLQDQQDRIYQDVVKQKESTFQKVYGDLNRASNSQDAVIVLDKRSRELADIQRQVYENQAKSAGAITEDKNLAGRKYEMNQWSVSNKDDTLFVFSSLFILLSSLILLTLLWRRLIISSALYGSLSGLFILIFILMVIYRANYTNILRNNRYWNRRNFDGKYGKIVAPNCADLSKAATNAANMADRAGDLARQGIEYLY
jgi:uncharacterized membrane protein